MSIFRKEYDIEAAGFSITSNHRKGNEDNMVINHVFLSRDHADEYLETHNEEDISSVAVFDGIGGEPMGEVASFLAAEYYANNWHSQTRDMEQHMVELSIGMGEKIAEYGMSHNCPNMGSTMAALIFAQGKIHGMNLGDSGIYRLTKKGVCKLSHDHVITKPGRIKGYLSAYLGGDEVTIPYYFKTRVRDGDVFLLYTDGVVDVMPENVIRKTLACSNNAKEIAEQLLTALEGRVPHDNSTAIVLTVRKK